MERLRLPPNKRVAVHICFLLAFFSVLSGVTGRVHGGNRLRGTKAVLFTKAPARQFSLRISVSKTEVIQAALYLRKVVVIDEDGADLVVEARGSSTDCQEMLQSIPGVLECQLKPSRVHVTIHSSGSSGHATARAGQGLDKLCTEHCTGSGEQLLLMSCGRESSSFLVCFYCKASMGSCRTQNRHEQLVWIGS